MLAIIRSSLPVALLKHGIRGPMKNETGEKSVFDCLAGNLNKEM